MAHIVKTISDKYVNLTAMELQVVAMVKEGKSNKEIADLLRLSENTVKFHRFNIRSKLGIKGKRNNLKCCLDSFPQ